MTIVLATQVKDGKLGRTEKFDCADLETGNKFADTLANDENVVWVGCVKVGNKIKRVF